MGATLIEIRITYEYQHMNNVPMTILVEEIMRLCLFLLLAGILDAILTQFGIMIGIIEEGNPVMEFAIEKGWTLFYLIKILLPLLLIGLFYLRPLKGRIRTLLVATCVLYLVVLCYHLVWILLFLNPAA
jgi:hypothetical protein